jgi:hypothetical protein
MKKILTLSLLLLGVVFLAGCGKQQVSQNQPMTPASVEKQQTTTSSTADNILSSKITALEQKWKKGGLVNWQKEDFIFPGFSIIAPKNLPKSFIISTDPNKIKSMDASQIGDPISGVVSVGEYGEESLWGTCSIVKSDLPQGISLEQWIQNTWHNVIAKNDCNGKNQPLSEKTLRGETWSDVCKKGAHIENKLNDGLITWDAAYIGSPPIVSTVVGNNIVSFECGQDVSSADPLNDQGLINLIEDIAETLR